MGEPQLNLLPTIDQIRQEIENLSNSEKRIYLAGVAKEAINYHGANLYTVDSFLRDLVNLLPGPIYFVDIDGTLTGGTFVSDNNQIYEYKTAHISAASLLNKIRKLDGTVIFLTYNHIEQQTKVYSSDNTDIAVGLILTSLEVNLRELELLGDGDLLFATPAFVPRPTKAALLEEEEVPTNLASKLIRDYLPKRLADQSVSNADLIERISKFIIDAEGLSSENQAGLIAKLDGNRGIVIQKDIGFLFEKRCFLIDDNPTMAGSSVELMHVDNKLDRDANYAKILVDLFVKAEKLDTLIQDLKLETDSLSAAIYAELQSRNLVEA